MEIREYLTAMLENHDVSVKKRRESVGGHLSGTERHFFPLSARVNFFDHPNFGVARQDPPDQLVKSGAMERDPHSCGLRSLNRAATTTPGRGFAIRPPKRDEGRPRRLLTQRTHELLPLKYGQATAAREPCPLPDPTVQ